MTGFPHTPWAITPFRASVIRGVVGGFALTFLLGSMVGGTAPLRLFYPLAFFLSVARPWWGVMAIALLGPLSLLDPGTTHRLVQTEAFVLGTIWGSLLRWPRPLSDSGSLKSTGLAGGSLVSDGKTPVCGPATPTLWPSIALAIAFGVMASLLPGLLLTLSGEDVYPHPDFFIRWAAEIFYGYGTTPTWSVRSAYNWISCLLLAWVVCREVTPRNARIFLYLGATSAVAASFVGLGEMIGLWSLTGWRAVNPDLIRLGSRRLMSLAGHSGWFAEWILLTWPGLWLAWGGGRKRKILVAVAMGITAAALLLTLQRAGWLGAMVALGILALYYQRSGLLRRGVLIGIAAMLVLVGLAALAIAHGELLSRFGQLFRIQDRLNYYFTTYHLISLHPGGVGIGLHFVYYESLFTPFHWGWQHDHVTAHSTWLHLAVEQGPVQACLVGAAFAGLFVAVWRRRAQTRMDPERKPILLALVCILAGMGVDSLVQYLGYLRIVEVMVWICIGCLLGLLPRNAKPPGDEVGRNFHGLLRVGLLCLSGLGAAIIMGHHARRDAAHPYPRPLILEPQSGALEVWTANQWKFPVDPRWCGIEFTLTATHRPQEVTVRAPGYAPRRVRIEPGTSSGFWYAFPPLRDATPLTPYRWLEIECPTLWTPARSIAWSDDWRRLGVYVSGLRPLYCDDDPRRPASQHWREDHGAMPQARHLHRP
jgi:hypothetical protein